MTHIPVRPKKEKFYREGELVHYFPENTGQPFEVSTVVKHAAHPDTTIGFVSRIEEDPMGDAIRSLNEVSKRIQKNAGIENIGDSFDDKKVGHVYFIEWSSPPPADINPFASFIAPVVRRVNYSQIGKQLINVQPMSVPKGGIFYLDYKYGDKTEEIKEEYTIGVDPCEENSQSTSGTALEKSGWGSAIRTFFTRASTGVASVAKKIVKLVVEFISFSR